MDENKKINSKQEIYLRIALSLNKDMYDSKLISYNIFKNTEEALIKKIKSVI